MAMGERAKVTQLLICVWEFDFAALDAMKRPGPLEYEDMMPSPLLAVRH